MSAIVASTIPLAVGAAYCQKLSGKRGVAVVFFGDGATDAGVFWESVNFAALKRLPVLFVYEDNDLAVHTRVAERRGYESIDSIIERFNISVYRALSKSVEDIYDVASRAVSELREDGSQPCFLSLVIFMSNIELLKAIQRRSFSTPCSVISGCSLNVEICQKMIYSVLLS